MPIFNLPETVEIPFDSLTNEQRAAIHTVMSGDGLINPLSEKIQKCREAIRHEISIFNGFQLQVPPGGAGAGGCVECPISGCPTLIGQQRVEIMYQLELLLYWLDVLELHTDKLSGSKVEYIDNFFQRLSTAGSYSSAMKSITGQNIEKFSSVFRSLMGQGDNCLDRILSDFWGPCSEGPTYCGSGGISINAGVVGLAQGVCTGNVAACAINSFLPSLLECLKDLIEEDELNYCEAKKIVDKYAAAQRLTSDATNDPIMGAIVKSLFATPELSDALRRIQDEEFSEDFTQSTAEFFPEFTDETGRVTDCEGAPLVAVGPPGEKGDPGLDGCKGPQGLPGAPGVDGECYDPNSPCGGTQGACCVNGFCLEVTQTQCEFYSGTYFGDNFLCIDVPEGACEPTGCGNDAECGEGKVCCGGQCTTPCIYGQANGGGCNNCPPCSQCPDCTDGCGGNCDIGEGNICCNGVVTVECPGGGGCPDCQGSCCPPGYVCCGGDGCVLEEFCLEGSECDGLLVCGDNCCQESGNGLGCCGGGCPCPAGVDCCNGSCCPSADLGKCCGGDQCCPPGGGGDCCNNGCPCLSTEECCPDGCREIVDCSTTIAPIGEFCGETISCGPPPECEDCEQCACGGSPCGDICCPDSGCEDGDGNQLTSECCAATNECCNAATQTCRGICGCCPKAFLADGVTPDPDNDQICCNGECTAPCTPGGGCGNCGPNNDECCDATYTCNGVECPVDCGPFGCCDVNTPIVGASGLCEPVCCADNAPSCGTPFLGIENCHGPAGFQGENVCGCDDGYDCCYNPSTNTAQCCPEETHYCQDGLCLKKCVRCDCDEDGGSDTLDCQAGCSTTYIDPTLDPNNDTDCGKCCEAVGGSCCGDINSFNIYCGPGEVCPDDGNFSTPTAEQPKGCCPEEAPCCETQGGTDFQSIPGGQCCASGVPDTIWDDWDENVGGDDGEGVGGYGPGEAPCGSSIPEQSSVCCAEPFVCEGLCGSPHDDRIKPPPAPNCGNDATLCHCDCCPVREERCDGSIVWLRQYKLSCAPDVNGVPANCQDHCSGVCITGRTIINDEGEEEDETYPCDRDVPQDPTGACCLTALQCDDGLTETECLARTGDFNEDKTCAEVFCRSDENEPCDSEADCKGAMQCCDFGDVFPDLRCTRSSCPEDGQCCYFSSDVPTQYPICINEKKDRCISLYGGTWSTGKCRDNNAGPNGEDLCLPRGSFCQTTEDCAEYPECQDYGCECVNDFCAPIGTCCAQSSPGTRTGSCSAETQASCDSTGGYWVNPADKGEPVCQGCESTGEDQYLCFSDTGPYFRDNVCDCELGVCCTKNAGTPTGTNSYQCNVDANGIDGITRSECDRIVSDSNGALELVYWKTCKTPTDCPNTCIPDQGCCYSQDGGETHICAPLNHSLCESIGGLVIWGGCSVLGDEGRETGGICPQDKGIDPWCCCCDANIANPGIQPVNDDGNGNLSCDDCCVMITDVERPGDFGAECGEGISQHPDCNCASVSGTIDCGCQRGTCCDNINENYDVACEQTTEPNCKGEKNWTGTFSEDCTANQNDVCDCDEACPRGACCFGLTCEDGYLQKVCEQDGGVWHENVDGTSNYCATGVCGVGECANFPDDGIDCGACCEPCQTGGGEICTTPTPCTITTPDNCEYGVENHYPGLSCYEAGCTSFCGTDDDDCIPDPGFWCCCRPGGGPHPIGCTCMNGSSSKNPCPAGGVYRVGYCPGNGATCGCSRCCTECDGQGVCAECDNENLRNADFGDEAPTRPEGEGPGSGRLGRSRRIPSGATNTFKLRNLPESPCGGTNEFCVDSLGNGQCCPEGHICCNGQCVQDNPRNPVCAYSSVTTDYYYCPEGFCQTLNPRTGAAVCKNAKSTNCPELSRDGGRSRRLVEVITRLNSKERTYSGYRGLEFNNRDFILQSSYDEQGRLSDYFIEVIDRPVRGGQVELERRFPLGVRTQKDRQQQKLITAPIKFQIVNYVADDKIKTDTRPTTKTLGLTDTKSKISKAELRDGRGVGRPGAQVNGVDAQTIKGEMTAVIGADNIMTEAQVVTFVSGSNIRLDTNENANIIRISVDDLNLWELVDVDDGVSAASNNDILQYDSTDGVWKAVALSVGVTGATGPVGPVGGADGQILFNDSGGASGNGLLTFNDATTTLTVGTGVTTNLLGGMSAGGASDFNDNIVNEAKLVDYSEKVNAIGTINTSPYGINIENGNVQTFTAGGNFTLAFLNPPASGAAGSLTLIITNGGAHTITFPSSVKWSSGVAPTLTSSGTDILSFTTIDGGTNWYGFVGGLGFA